LDLLELLGWELPLAGHLLGLTEQEGNLVVADADGSVEILGLPRPRFPGAQELMQYIGTHSYQVAILRSKRAESLLQYGIVHDVTSYCLYGSSSVMHNAG